MSLTLYHLDEITRKYMQDEILYDRIHKRFYLDHWLSVKGRKDLLHLLTQAVESYDDAWLSEQLAKEERLNNRSWSRKGQKFLTPEIPIQIAEDSFNRYYIRALCQRALLSNQEYVFSYQAKPVLDPMIQKQFQKGAYPPKQMLQEMREYVIGASITGIPGGPGAGISIRLTHGSI